MLNICLALLPVLLLLCGLLLMDSFKLLRPSSLAAALAWGAAVALVSQPLHEWLLDDVGVALTTLTRYVAPATEEVLKAAFVVLLLARKRIGFLDRCRRAGLRGRHRFRGRRELRLPPGDARSADGAVAGARPRHGHTARRDDSHCRGRGQGLPGTEEAGAAAGGSVAAWRWPSRFIRRTTTCSCRRWRPPSSCSSCCRSCSSPCSIAARRRPANGWAAGMDVDLERLECAHLAAVQGDELRHLSPGAEIALRRAHRRRHGVPAAAAAGDVGAGARAC